MFKLPRLTKSLKYITYLESKRNFQRSARCSRIFQFSPNAKMCKSLIDYYGRLPLPDCLSMLHYIWIDGTGAAMRSKDIIIHIHPRCLQEFPICEANGAECYIAESTKDPDILLNPVKYFDDPFRISQRCHNRIVLTEVIFPSGQPADSNFRRCLIEALDHVEEHQVLFGMGQQYTMLDMNLRPLGWPHAMGYPAPEGPYCYGVGADRVIGRDIAETLFRAALYAGIEFTGSIIGKYLGMWEFQLAQVEGSCCADHLWLTRYLLIRIAEEYGVVISFDPKPMEGDEWTTNALETYFSSLCMRREEDGINEIEKAIDKLSKNHLRHMQVYDAHCGLDNVRRLGDCYSEFTSGVSDRSVSVRIPRKVAMNKRGWLEDLRPAANADPYQVCNAIVRTVLLDE